MLLRTVIQEDESGCALACLAMLSGLDYQTVRQRFAGRIYSFWGGSSLAVDDETMREFCAELQVEMGADTDFTDWDILRNQNRTALVAINPKGCRNGSKDWHWVVYDGKTGCVRDPYYRIKTHERQDFGRMRPFFYAWVRRLGRN